MAVSIHTAPTWEPVTLAEAKIALRVDTEVEDSFISGLISAARQYAERFTGLSISAVTLEENMERWPFDCDSATIPLSGFPVREITSVKYWDETETEQTMPESDYWKSIKTFPARIRKKDGQMPCLHADRLDPVSIIYTAGYAAAADVPETIKNALKLLVCYWFENREDTDINNNTNQFVRSAHALLNQHKLWR